MHSSYSHSIILRITLNSHAAIHIYMAARLSNCSCILKHQQRLQHSKTKHQAFKAPKPLPQALEALKSPREQTIAKQRHKNSLASILESKPGTLPINLTSVLYNLRTPRCPPPTREELSFSANSMTNSNTGPADERRVCQRGKRGFVRK